MTSVGLDRLASYRRLGERLPGRRPELDGLRGLAIALVMLGHAEVPLLTGVGFSGVTAFFVLSGYLITGLLVVERDDGGIDLRNFYLRRAVRLGPALLVLLAAVSALGIAGLWSRPWLPGVAASLLYVANWVQIAGVDTGAMAHAWSLAIEEQFYLLWPLALILLPRRSILPIAIVGAIAGSGLYLARTPGFYFSTLTNGGALLAGCAVALWSRRLPAIAGSLGIALVIAGALVASQTMAVVGATLIVGSRSIALRPLASIGRRAYSLYLWDWPLTMLLGPGLLSAIAAIAAAETSFRFVERPAIAAMHYRLRRREDRVGRIFRRPIAIQVLVPVVVPPPLGAPDAAE